jgi:hypothetical protein
MIRIYKSKVRLRGIHFNPHVSVFQINFMKQTIKSRHYLIQYSNVPSLYIVHKFPIFENYCLLGCNNLNLTRVSEENAASICWEEELIERSKLFNLAGDASVTSS